jgi:hypothetical protein
MLLSSKRIFSDAAVSPSTQWAAVSTKRAWTSVPVQNQLPGLFSSATTEGYWLDGTCWPPMMDWSWAAERPGLGARERERGGEGGEDDDPGHGELLGGGVVAGR